MCAGPSLFLGLHSEPNGTGLELIIAAVLLGRVRRASSSLTVYSTHDQPAAEPSGGRWRAREKRTSCAFAQRRGNTLEATWCTGEL